MSEDNTDNKKIIGAKLHFTECDRGGLHITDIEPITDDSIVYDAPDADDILASSSVGWSRRYADNWERNFGKTEEVSEDTVN